MSIYLIAEVLIVTSWLLYLTGLLFYLNYNKSFEKIVYKPLRVLLWVFNWVILYGFWYYHTERVVTLWSI